MVPPPTERRKPMTPLPVTPALHENSVILLPPPPSSSSSSSPPPDLPLMADDQSAAATEIHSQMLPCPLSTARGNTVVTVEEEEEDEEEKRAKEELRLKEEWVKQMRGWLMILATLAASVTYTAGLNPPGGFWQDDSAPSPNGSIKAHIAGNPVLADKSPIQYLFFFTCNAIAFASSIAIIVLLLNQSIFHAEVRLALLKVFVVGGMCTIMVAFTAGSTRNLIGVICADILVLGSFFFFILCVWLKKSPTRRPLSSQERDVELGAMGEQISPDH
ncbi:hypothetical protein COCNU_01G013730 [Cocos nucifera]|uniref:PGG domain-containing protein n=1 Tax=Cocos nucifera TaxID=13894 RepID=A0A8K0HWI3_COCNU|nr:hypothetical protein COCNU_01G013730 [Cocos nucifera]